MAIGILCEGAEDVYPKYFYAPEILEIAYRDG